MVGRPAVVRCVRAPGPACTVVSIRFTSDPWAWAKSSSKSAGESQLSGRVGTPALE
jgi:hypothetical protein